MNHLTLIAAFLGAAFLSPQLVPAEPAKPAPPAKKNRKKNLPPYLETGGERKLDIVYKKIGKRELQLDLYYPTAKRAEKSPIIVYTHGGGWAAGSRAGVARGSFGILFKKLLSKGFAVASVDYRKYSKGGNISMRDCVIDSKDALRFLSKNAESLKLDTGQIYVIGDSAGGHIAQILLLTSPKTLTGDADLAKVNYQIRAGVSWYGPCDFENMNLFNHDDRPDFKDRFGARIIAGKEVSPEEKLRLYREMSPINYLKKTSPPLLMIQGDKDTTIPVKHAYYMEKKAQEIKAPVKTVIVKNSGHNWRKVDADIEPSREEIIRMTVEFFVNHSKNL